MLLGLTENGVCFGHRKKDLYHRIQFLKGVIIKDNIMESKQVPGSDCKQNGNWIAFTCCKLLVDISKAWSSLAT